LAEHRQPANDKQPGNDAAASDKPASDKRGNERPGSERTLSILERSAFREIGERLRKDSSGPAEPQTSDSAGAERRPDAASAADKPGLAAEQPKADERKADESDLTAPRATSHGPVVQEDDETFETA
ncbi:hypothetical protein EN818_31015, partial [Mesorhizobium sp. M3A.F.Ca.ET.175.01.1.1]|uniref:hypothetical protein n=1 Tax=Mesorhizobium sp. M3A.F.Ca.ET.175.01.1.1 TaxID=2563945 RepID=UPI001093419C